MNKIESILFDNAQDKSAVFVFPTEIAASAWADRLLEMLSQNAEVAGGSQSVLMERFTAWDHFKSSAIRARKQDKNSIPSDLRKLFCADLIEKNARDAAFSFLIPREYAKTAQSFSSYLASLLPQLSLWQESFRESGSAPDDEDRDLQLLMKRYCDFLEKNNLFENAWEKPPLSDADGKTYFIFFPEIFSDWAEYKTILENAHNINIVSVKNIESSPNRKKSVFSYDNAFAEIASGALYIQHLHEKENVAYHDIAVSLGDDKNYEPYVLREFALRSIPYKKRIGKALSDYRAGSFFKNVADAVQEKFSFKTLTALLLNDALPWKAKEVIEQLVEFGIKNNCLYSWTNVDVWLDAFHSSGAQTEERARLFYVELKKKASALAASLSFSEIRTRYFEFRLTFFSDIQNDTAESNGKNAWLHESDIVISRCISELNTLIALESDFPDVKPPSHFAFFVQILQERVYLEEQNQDGVSILPYKAAAAAYFPHHIVLGATQENLLVKTSHLAFLNSEKRENLDMLAKDRDNSADFIALYDYCSNTKFFFSAETFTGYALMHTALDDAAPAGTENDIEKIDTFDLIDPIDPFLKEQLFFAKDIDTFPEYIYKSQQDSFAAFCEMHSIENIAAKKQNFDALSNSESQKISASGLKVYCKCALKWYYERVLHLKNQQTVASLMQNNVAGLVYHAVIEQFFATLGEKDRVLHSFGETEAQILRQSAESVFGLLPRIKNENVSRVTARLVSAQKDIVTETLFYFLTQFLEDFSGSTFLDAEKYLDYASGKYLFHGSVDLLLKTPSGGSAIIDFKTGATPTKKECLPSKNATIEDICDFQMPMYKHLAERNGYAPVDSGVFYSIKKSGAKTAVFPLKPITSEDGVEIDAEQILMDAFDKTAKAFADNVAKKDFSALPKNLADCYSCEYKAVCRRTYNAA